MKVMAPILNDRNCELRETQVLQITSKMLTCLHKHVELPCFIVGVLEQALVWYTLAVCGDIHLQSFTNRNKPVDPGSFSLESSNIVFLAEFIAQKLEAYGYKSSKNRTKLM